MNYKLRMASHYPYEPCLLHELRVTVYSTSYELLFAYELRVTFSCTTYELLSFHIAEVTSYYLLHELRVTFCIQVTSYYFITRVTFLKIFCFIYHWPVFNMKNVLETWFAKMLRIYKEVITKVKTTLAR